MKVYVVCICHPTCFTQHGSPFILSLNVKSKMVTDMLLPVTPSELVDSDDEKPRRGKSRESISFLNLSFFLFPLYTFFSLLAFYLKLLVLYLFLNFFPFSNLHTRKIKPKNPIFEVNTISVFETIPPKNQAISIH